MKIQILGYNETDQILSLLIDGKTYEYKDINPFIYRKLKNAKDPGRVFNRLIKR